MKKKVLVINYYQAKDRNAPGVREIVKSIEDAGGQVDVVHHSQAKKLIAEDVLSKKKYKSFHATGSDIKWEEKDGYMVPGANALDLANYLMNHSTPGQFDCGSSQAAYHAIGGKIVHTHKFNRKEINGYRHNHTYAMEAESVEKGGLEKKVSNVTTFEHQGGRYVSSVKVGNNKLMQYHPGRSKRGVEDLQRDHGLKLTAAKKHGPSAAKIGNYRR